MSTVSRTERSIPIQPWFKDHAFHGHAVLPAVETMELLAGQVKKDFPDWPTTQLKEGSFPRFLALPEDQKNLAVVIELAQVEEDTIKASLLTRKKVKAFTRLVSHGSVTFFRNDQDKKPAPICTIPTDAVTEELEASFIYQELVPFGPAYQSLTGILQLSKTQARGKLLAPQFPGSEHCLTLGSPFPLDGAMHAACVLGQQLVEYIPFPVGFEQRIIHAPTRPGHAYVAHVQLVEHKEEALIFNLNIVDQEWNLCESICGIGMRDVSSAFVT